MARMVDRFFPRCFVGPGRLLASWMRDSDHWRMEPNADGETSQMANLR